VMMSYGDDEAVTLVSDPGGDFQLFHNDTDFTYEILDPDGTQYVFADFDTAHWSAGRRGTLIKSLTPGGISTEVTWDGDYPDTVTTDLLPNS